MDLKRLLISGEWVAGTQGGSVTTIDPSDGTALADLSVASEDDVKKATSAAWRAAEEGWPPSHERRAEILRSCARIVRENAAELAELETREQGRPLQQSEAIAAAAAASFDYFSTICRPRDETNSRSEEHLRLTTWDPVGVVAHILPWNFPLSMAANRIAMTIASGCTTVVKPSSLASLSVLRLCELIQEELPPGVVNVVLGGSSCGTALVTDPLVRKVSFTGSTEVGVEVMKQAADSVKRVTLELGGKTPFIVLEDADVDLAARAACRSSFINQGQSCAATSRILVHESIFDGFTDRMLDLTNALVVGPGSDPKTDVGPLISFDHRDSVARYVDDAVERGAKAITGGAIPEGLDKGSYYLPTVLTNVNESMPAWREEVFGPVVGIMPFSTEDEAISLANDSPFGLCASLWTGDLGRAQRVTPRLEAGVVWVNAAHIVALDSPWGGVKQSGVGRILGEAGLTGYLEPKQVHIDLAPGAG